MKTVLLSIGILIGTAIGLSPTQAQLSDANLSSTFPVFKAGTDLENLALLEGAAVLAEGLADFELAEVYRELAAALLASGTMSNFAQATEPTQPAPTRQCMIDLAADTNACRGAGEDCRNAELLPMPGFSCSDYPFTPDKTGEEMCNWMERQCHRGAQQKYADCVADAA